MARQLCCRGICKLRSYIIASNHVTVNQNIHWIWIMVEKLSVKRDPECGIAKDIPYHALEGKLVAVCYIQLSNISKIHRVSSTGVDQFSVFIRERSLDGGMDYRLDAECWTPGSDVFVASLSFKVNKVPYGGTCVVDPLQGDNLTT